jgi:heterotetrameric sarcosine oxidase gamma subunit
MLEPLKARSGFDGLLAAAGPAQAGVVVEELKNLQIATVIARRRDAFSERLRSSYQLELPSGPRREVTEPLTLLGTGPRTWLAMRRRGKPLAPELARELEETAAVTDQSDSYAVLRLSGPMIRATFEKGLGVDLHPRAFEVGDVAVTTCSHIGVVVWQTDEAPTYELAVLRSYAGSLWHWLAESAAEFGLAVR